MSVGQPQPCPRTPAAIEEPADEQRLTHHLAVTNIVIAKLYEPSAEVLVGV